MAPGLWKGLVLQWAEERLTTIDYISDDFVEAALNRTDGEGARETGHYGWGNFFASRLPLPDLYGSILTLLSTTRELAHTNTARLRKP